MQGGPKTPSPTSPFAGLGRDASSAALVHLYRGEVARSSAWRQRLDATTNWAVVTTGAALTFAFGAVDHAPAVILIVSLLVLLFLVIEARRYRYYELWAHRARLIEGHFYADLLVPPASTTDRSESWRRELADSLQEPRFPIGLLEALGRRYRRNYAPLLGILAVAWLVKISIHPQPAANLGEAAERAAIGPISGWAVLGFGVLFQAVLVGLGLFTVGLRDSDAEVFAGGKPVGRLLGRLRAATREALDIDLRSFRPGWVERRKRLVIVISDQVDAVSKPLLESLNRGVTQLQGVGMYSGEARNVLLCVVEGRQVRRLRRLVTEVDPRAFIVVAPATDVRGEGFRQLVR